MLTVAQASRLFCAITFTVVMTPALADWDWDETPEYAWKTYLSDCQRLQQALTNVQNGSHTAKDVTPSIESSLRTLTVHRKNLAQTSHSSPDYARCESIIPQAKEIAAKGNAENDEALDQHFRQAQTEHLNSPEYKRARSMGFSDVGEIGALDQHAELDGEANLKTLMIKVDAGCGSHFRAAQYVKPYVIYTVRPWDGNCAVYKRVAVLGGETVERGDDIDENGIFQYVGWKTLTGADGFPFDIRVVKARK
ncbi:hypothetical protein ACIOYV_12730 [Pseudomonas sp. NPDC087342]|uniref:hypothetical protein n=1 Tax=Pseudomonas sp. NPDC087342 TaxID=3364437 RepID=UPI003822E4EE